MNNNELKENKQKENPFGAAVMDDKEKEKLIQEKLATLKIKHADDNINKKENVPIKIMKNENLKMNIDNNNQQEYKKDDYKKLDETKNN